MEGAEDAGNRPRNVSRAAPGPGNLPTWCWLGGRYGVQCLALLPTPPRLVLDDSQGYWLAPGQRLGLQLAPVALHTLPSNCRKTKQMQFWAPRPQEVAGEGAAAAFPGSPRPRSRSALPPVPRQSPLFRFFLRAETEQAVLLLAHPHNTSPSAFLPQARLLPEVPAPPSPRWAQDPPW